jgi:hypothetical protein
VTFGQESPGGGGWHLEKSKWRLLYRHSAFVSLNLYLEEAVPNPPSCLVIEFRI